MNNYISCEAAIEYLMTNMGWNDEDGYPVYDADEKRKIITDLISGIPVANVIDGNELFKCIAGHSYYSGNDILTRISVMQEGKHPQNGIPAADVRPVVRGEWEPAGGSVFPIYACSQCCAISLGGNFCPNCGADIREVKADG